MQSHRAHGPAVRLYDRRQRAELGRAGGWETLGPEGLGVPGLGPSGAAGLWFAVAESWVRA